MVPFPIVLPVPLPIPIPIPIPPDIMEKYSKAKETEKHSTSQPKSDNGKCDQLSHHKRKNSSEYSKQKKKRKSSVNATNTSDHVNSEVDIHERNNQTEKHYNSTAENLCYRLSETPTTAVLTQPPTTSKVLRSELDLESRSYSPVSEAMSSNEDEYSERTRIKNGELDDFSNINFSSFNLNLMRSSPLLLSQTAERHLQIGTNENLENCNSQSPTNLSVKDKHSFMSSSAVNFKKKHLHDQLSLMT
ncbi:sine oculis-binding [Caerostris extrusa]|uniref:Sine oculis-binding n=1 Tax=Caerostris extrusa TaxID=172846 RepID=A0AAV4VEQ7_CAEEX|nr:sine oculis-binding [Caerostris extrusa]